MKKGKRTERRERESGVEEERIARKKSSQG